MLDTVVFEVDVERPQDLTAPIRRTEAVVAVFSEADAMPAILAGREDFPDTPHQNASPAAMPRALCIDERPWDEARSAWTPFSFIQRIRWWLSSAASGELSGSDQAVEPLFMHRREDLVVPRSVLEADAVAVSLLPYLPPVNDPRVLLARAEAPPKDFKQAELRLLTARLPTQVGQAIRGAPGSLAELMSELQMRGYDLKSALREEIYSALSSAELLQAKLAVLVIIPVARTSGEAPELHELKAFITTRSIGEVGTDLGYLISSSEAKLGFVRSIPPVERSGSNVELGAVRAVLDFDRTLAASCAGLSTADERKAVLVGAGAVGSHLAMNLAREGRFRWIIIDDDYLLPHNLARHELTQTFLGFPKAPALAFEVGELLNQKESAVGLVAKVSRERMKPEVVEALTDADLIIDASASVATSRLLSDFDAGLSRRTSVFLNPRGTAAVLLAEDDGRSVRLDSIEAQYYRVLLRTPELQEHLAPPELGFRYSGSCRAVSSRIPATSVAALVGVAAKGLTGALARQAPGISIWSLADDGSVQVVRATPSPVQRCSLGNWTVILDDDLVATLRDLRQCALPAETGGSLVGIIDNERQTVTLVDALPPPADSSGNATEFVRGTEGLLEKIKSVQAITADQVRYVGEWHSHPNGHSVRPSAVDLDQLDFLRAELERESVPPVMVIVGRTKLAIISPLRSGTASATVSAPAAALTPDGQK